MSEPTGYTGGPGDNFGHPAVIDTTSSEQLTNAVYAQFDEARWRRVGATDDEVVKLAASHARSKPEKQLSEGKRLASQPDSVLADELAGARGRWGTGEETAADNEEDWSGTISDVLDKVGEDKTKAASALDFEEEHKNRVSLVAALEEIIAAE